MLNRKQYFQLKTQLLDIIDEKKDSLRLYHIPEPHDEHIEKYGTGNIPDLEGPLII